MVDQLLICFSYQKVLPEVLQVAFERASERGFIEVEWGRFDEIVTSTC